MLAIVIGIVVAIYLIIAGGLLWMLRDIRGDRGLPTWFEVWFSFGWPLIAVWGLGMYVADCFRK